MEVVDLNKKPEPKPEPVTAIALEAPPVVEQKPEPAPQEQPQPEPAKTDTAVNDLHPETKQEPEVPRATVYFTYSDANLFKKLFEAMSVLVDEVIWKFDADSLMVRHMDPSRVAMFDLTIKKEDFEEWNVTKPGYCCFNIEEVKKIVFGKPLKKDTLIRIAVDGEHSRIAFTLKDNRTRERSFPTLEPSIEEIPTPKITHNAAYKVIAKQVAEDIDDLNRISDHMTLIGTNDTLRMTAEGEYTKGDTTYKRGDDTLLDIELREESKATYSFSYLKEFIDPALCDLILIQFSTDMPMKMTLCTRFGELAYWLAPRVECD